MRKVLAVALLATSLVTPVRAGEGPIAQDDAGTGRDAPDVATASFTVAPDTVYDGFTDGVLDSADWYAFGATAGQPIEARVFSSVGCVYLFDSSGTEIEATCSLSPALPGRTSVVAPATGTYYLRYLAVGPTQYRFSVGIGDPAPDPTPAELAGLGGLTTLFPEGGPLAPVSPASQAGEHVVVAVVDTGVNLYHDFFRAPALSAHPSTWLPGFPTSATSVPLTLGAPDYASARAADAAAFAGMSRSAYDPGTSTYDEHLYTFPGTRVVAGISFGEYGDDALVEPQGQPVVDDHSHGTHSAGLAGGANLAAADGNVLVVAVEIGKGTFEDGVRWAARQPWIDAISVSLGTKANAFGALSLTDENGMQFATAEAARSGKPVFMASGNGVSNTGLAPDKCGTYTSEYTGPAWVTRVGAARPDDGSPTWWHCVPVDTVARTDVMSPVVAGLSGADDAGGTSAATPNAAGHFAHLLLAGRRAGVTTSRAATLEHLLHAAAPVAFRPGQSDPSVYPLSLADQGYGLVDQRALNVAKTRLLAGSGPAPRPETVEWFAADTEVRTSLWGSADPDDETPVRTVTESAAVVTESRWQNDAGSGGDAPNDRSDDLPVVPGVRYEGMQDGVIDNADWYAFDAAAGDVATVTVAAATACVDVVRPSGTVAASTCSIAYALTADLSVPIDEPGTWHLDIGYFVPQKYAFAYTLDGSAPPAVVP